MHLIRLRSHPEFRLHEGEPDLYQYMVMGSTGEAIGQVSDLIADSEAMNVRYLVVTLFHPGGARKLVPLTALHLDEPAQTATCIGLDCTDPNLAAFPDDPGGELPADFAHRFVGTFIPGSGTALEPAMLANEPVVPRTYAISRQMPHLKAASDAMLEAAHEQAEEEHRKGIRHPGDEAA